VEACIQHRATSSEFSARQRGTRAGFTLLLIIPSLLNTHLLPPLKCAIVLNRQHIITSSVSKSGSSLTRSLGWLECKTVKYNYTHIYIDPSILHFTFIVYFFFFFYSSSVCLSRDRSIASSKLSPVLGRDCPGKVVMW
jgi:hypothetical protein